MLSRLPQARALITNRGYDGTPFRTGLQTRSIMPCISRPAVGRYPSRTTRRSTASATASRSWSAG